MRAFVPVAVPILAFLGGAGLLYGDARWARADDVKTQAQRIQVVEKAIEQIDPKLDEIRCLILDRRWVLGKCAPAKTELKDD